LIELSRQQMWNPSPQMSWWSVEQVMQLIDEDIHPYIYLLDIYRYRYDTHLSSVSMNFNCCLYVIEAQIFLNGRGYYYWWNQVTWTCDEFEWHFRHLYPWRFIHSHVIESRHNEPKYGTNWFIIPYDVMKLLRNEAKTKE